MWTRALLKKNAKEAFQRNYWTCVGVSLLALILSGGFSFGTSSTVQSSDTSAYSLESLIEYLATVPDYIWTIIRMVVMVSFAISICLTIFVTNVVRVGCNRYFLENREHKTGVGQLFYSFQGGRFGSTVWVMFLKSLYIFGWTCLFIIPGIIKAYSYQMVPYIMAENPNMDRKRVFELSEQMMKGHKWEAFTLELSFYGWILLSLFTYGILNIFYVNPYIYATYAELYCAIKAEAKMKGILQPGELPTSLIPEVEVE